MIWETVKFVALALAVVVSAVIAIRVFWTLLLLIWFFIL